MRIEPEGAELSFSRRLAAENGWSSGYAERVDAEYRRFLYLAATRDHAVTPSDEVDQAWHLHLVYTRSYWGELTEIIGRPLHHGPTAGGSLECRRYQQQYDDTLTAYEEVFGEKPPLDIWPRSTDRFMVRPIRIDRERHVPVDRGAIAFTMVALVFGAIALAADARLFAGIVMIIGVGLTLTTLLTDGATTLERTLHSERSGDGGSGGCASSDGGCGSGCGGGGCGCG